MDGGGGEIRLHQAQANSSQETRTNQQSPTRGTGGQEPLGPSNIASCRPEQADRRGWGAQPARERSQRGKQGPRRSAQVARGHPPRCDKLHKKNPANKNQKKKNARTEREKETVRREEEMGGTVGESVKGGNQSRGEVRQAACGTLPPRGRSPALPSTGEAERSRHWHDLDGIPSRRTSPDLHTAVSIKTGGWTQREPE